VAAVRRFIAVRRALILLALLGIGLFLLLIVLV
jgi:hypothetical protein